MHGNNYNNSMIYMQYKTHYSTVFPFWSLVVVVVTVTQVLMLLNPMIKTTTLHYASQ